METETWDAGVGTERARHPGGASRVGWKWFIFRALAAIIGATGWVCVATAGALGGVGALFVKWARDIHRTADEIRYEA